MLTFEQTTLLNAITGRLPGLSGHDGGPLSRLASHILSPYTTTPLTGNESGEGSFIHWDHQSCSDMQLKKRLGVVSQFEPSLDAHGMCLGQSA